MIGRTAGKLISLLKEDKAIICRCELTTSAFAVIQFRRECFLSYGALMSATESIIIEVIIYTCRYMLQLHRHTIFDKLKNANILMRMIDNYYIYSRRILF